MEVEGMPRVWNWVQQFQHNGGDTFQELGENFEYYLNHVEEYERGEFDYGELPNFGPVEKLVMHSVIRFGLEWAASDATLFVKSDPDGTFEGVYAHPQRALDGGDSDTEVRDEPSEYSEDLLNQHSIERVSVSGTDVRGTVDEFIQSEHEVSRDVGDCLQFILDNQDELDSGEKTADDFPHFSEGFRWLIMYSAMFGRLWEYSHPSLWAVLEDGRLVDLYWLKDDAESHEGGPYEVRRVNVEDGDSPESVVIPPEEGE